MEPGRPSDGELVTRTLAGDREAFGDLCDRYGRIVGALAFQKVGNAPDADDVVQEAFLKAYAALGELEDRERFGSWLYGIALRAAIDHHRRRGRRPGAAVSLDALRDRRVDVASGAEPASDGLERRENAEKVLEALGELPDKYRLVLTLRYQKFMSYKDISEHLGEPSGTVANRIHRAAAMLREKLKALIES